MDSSFSSNFGTETNTERLDSLIFVYLFTEEITASFSEVFSSVPLTSYDVINDDIRKCNKLKLNINTNFDFISSIYLSF